MAILAQNKKAGFDYEFIERYEAGLMLTGQEVKSIKTGHVSLKGSFVSLRDSEMFLVNANIPKYKFAGEIKNYDPNRPRKLLVKKSEIKSLLGKTRTKGLTLIPIRVYTKKRLIKVEFALAKGRKKFDKRQTIAKKEAERRKEKALKNF